MSPMDNIETAEQLGFPRVSGDEPFSAASGVRLSGFSPREWG